MRKLGPFKICVIVLMAVVNVIGANIALVTRLPIYLDSIGTVMCAALFGPACGIVSGVLGSFTCGITTDIYSLYYIPVQFATGFFSGMIFKKCGPHGWDIILKAACVSIPATVVGSVITACVFHGITSSGSALLVQLLNKCVGMNLTLSICLVQALTDYANCAVSIVAACAVLKVLPVQIKDAVRRSNISNGTI